MFRISSCWLVFLLTLSTGFDLLAAGTLTSTQLIQNATIIDGSGKPGVHGDLRFNTGGIIAVGQLEVLPGDTVLDAKGLVVAPGFIDSHSHHDMGLDASPGALAAVSQGITTIAVGVDGSSRYPLMDFRQKFKQHPAAINVASYTGHGTVRSRVMGADFKREANAEEVMQMQALLAADMQNGSLGLSTGLEYDPGIYSNTEEVILLAKTAANGGGRYTSHMRSEDRAFHEAVEELLQIGREAQIPVQISHMKLAAVNIWGQAGEVLQRLDAARATGIDVSADVYPYTYWESSLTVLLPERDFNDLEAARFALKNLAPADGLTLSSYAPDPSLVGQTVAQIAAQRGKSNEETYLQLIRDAYEGLSVEEIASLDEARESVIGVSMSEQDIAKLIAWEHANICSDGAAEGHPRGYGAFPRAIRMFVREQGIVSLEAMIHKMTALSALHLGISGRGLIKPGYAADLVLFDPAAITDHATIAQHDLLADGITGVWVNGVSVWQNRQTTGATPGVFVARAEAE